MEPTFASPSDRLSPSQVIAFLARLELPTSLYPSPPSLKLLSTILQAHHEQVPKDTTPLHVPSSDWEKEEDVPIVLGKAVALNGGQMPEGREAFERIVEEHKGAFCFGLNPTFAALLRSFDFRVSELTSKCYQALGHDPRTHEAGWKWGSWTHEVLAVDWPGEDHGGKRGEERYLVDVGFGGGSCTVPVPLHDGAQIQGQNPYEAYYLAYENLPLSPSAQKPIDSLKGYTFYRRITPPGVPATLPLPPPHTPSLEGEGENQGFWSPQFHFLLHSITARDLRLLHHFSASHELAAFTSFLLVTRVLPGTKGARRTLMCHSKMEKAKAYTHFGEEAKGGDEERDVVEVEMKTGPMRRFLEDEFGFIF